MAIFTTTTTSTATNAEHDPHNRQQLGEITAGRTYVLAQARTVATESVAVVTAGEVLPRDYSMFEPVVSATPTTSTHTDAAPVAEPQPSSEIADIQVLVDAAYGEDV